MMMTMMIMMVVVMVMMVIVNYHSPRLKISSQNILRLAQSSVTSYDLFLFLFFSDTIFYNFRT